MYCLQVYRLLLSRSLRPSTLFWPFFSVYSDHKEYFLGFFYLTILSLQTKSFNEPFRSLS